MLPNLSSEVQFRYRVLRNGSIIMGIIITAGISARYLIAPINIYILITNFAFGLILLSIPYLLKRGVSQFLLSALFLFGITQLGLTAGLGAGGMNAPGAMTLCSVPIAGFVVAGRRGANLGLVFTFGSIATILLAERYDLVIPALNDHRVSVARSLNIGLVAIGCYAVGSAFNRSRLVSEAELRRREEQIRTVIDTSPVGMVVIGQDLNVHISNRAARELLPNLRNEHSFLQAVPQDSVEGIMLVIQKKMRENESQPFANAPHRFSVARGKASAWLQITGVPFEDAGLDGAYRLLTITDVSEEVRAEDMRKAFLVNSKMAALGEMAGGVAHEINNPLSIIVGKCGALRARMADGAPDLNRVSEELDKIANTAKRISKITQGLLAFSRSGAQDEPVRIRLKEFVEETIAFCADRFANAKVSLSCNLNGNDDVVVVCRPSEISQVLLNLLNNAIDQVSSAPAEGQQTPEPWVRLEVEVKSGQVSFIVTDGGFGIPDAIKDKIFNPFFTTKPVGSGTGLGLSISTGLIESHGGVLTYSLDSKENKHTSFRATIPLNPPIAV